MKLLLSILIVLVITACSAKLLVPTQLDASRMEAKYPGYTLTDLNNGKSLVEANCGNCHGIKKPTSQSEEEWQEIVPRMVKQTNKKAGKEHLGMQDQELILRYLVTMSSVKK